MTIGLTSVNGDVRVVEPCARCVSLYVPGLFPANKEPHFLPSLIGDLPQDQVDRLTIFQDWKVRIVTRDVLSGISNDDCVRVVGTDWTRAIEATLDAIFAARGHRPSNVLVVSVSVERVHEGELIKEYHSRCYGKTVERCDCSSPLFEGGFDS